MSDIADFVRRTLRVIRMISELHRLGYQRVRFMPFEYPLAFRIAIAPAHLFSQTNGANLLDFDTHSHVQYSSASETGYFGWTDAAHDNARQLAEKFIARYPQICAAGAGRDWAYAGWLAELLWHLEQTPGALPIVQSEFMEPSGDDLVALPFRVYGQKIHDVNDAFPLPPHVLTTP
jgi:hypothetical protein